MISLHPRQANVCTKGKLNLQVECASRVLNPDGITKRGCERCTEALDVGFVLGFHHHARERFGAGITKNDAAIFAQGGLRFLQRARNFG